MRTPAVILTALVLNSSFESVAAQQLLTAPAVVEAFDRLTQQPLWPGFTPTSIPLLIHDGHRTWLFRHPQPPAEFRPAVGKALVMLGKHDLVRANTSVEFAGVPTATLLLTADTGSAEGWASVLVHETFHVFQRQRHPAWGGNEVDLFTYPHDDVETLTLRELETVALRRALDAPNRRTMVCWAQAALDSRSRRFARLPTHAIGYERGSEILEGLATALQLRALGEGGDDILAGSVFAADAVRERAYETGAALAMLLDRVSDGWQQALEERDTLSLDEALQHELEKAPHPSCDFGNEDRQAAARAARAAVNALQVRLAGLRDSAVHRDGWSVSVRADPAEPLFPQGFDPSNVHVVGRGEVVHARWIKLGNVNGTFEVDGRTALTEAAGGHPLFNGIRQILVSGLPERPELTTDSVIRLTGPGISGVFRHGEAAWSGQTLLITLRTESSPP